MVVQKKRLLTGKEIKERELDILLDFKQFCEEHNLRFYLAGGTLLGAIRHKGFIPWDDDIDVCMPRPDYEKLIDIYPETDKYVLRADKKENFIAPFAKLVDLNTQVESQYTKSDLNSKLWIDIFPVDGLPSSLDEAREIYRKCDFYRELLWLTDVKLGEGKTTFHKYARYVLKPLANLYGRRRCVNKLDSIAATNPYKESNYVGIVTWGMYGVGERMPKSEFENPTEVEFEGHQFPAFSCWDSYLHGIYGDYMQLPPVEQRKTHDMKVYVNE